MFSVYLVAVATIKEAEPPIPETESERETHRDSVLRALTSLSGEVTAKVATKDFKVPINCGELTKTAGVIVIIIVRIHAGERHVDSVMEAQACNRVCIVAILLSHEAGGQGGQVFANGQRVAPFRVVDYNGKNTRESFSNFLSKPIKFGKE